MNAFVSAISKNGADAYNVLKTALKESGQEHLANYIEEVEKEFISTDGDEVNVSATESVPPQEEKAIYTRVLTKVLQTFTEKLNLDSILISLLTEGILSADKLKDIKTQKTISDRMSAFVSEISKKGEDAYNVLKTALKESDQEYLANYIEEVEKEFTSSDGDDVNTNLSSLSATEREPPQASANELTSTPDQVLKGSDICNEIVDKSRNTKEDSVSKTAAAIKHILHVLGLTEHMKTKITTSEAIQIDLSGDESKTPKYDDIPFKFLQRLLAGNSDAMDYESYSSRKNIDSKSSGSVVDMYQRKKKRKISPLDLFLLVFQCCDPMLKQLLFQKLYICKLALPFIYTEYPSTKPVMSVWPLRSLVVETSNAEGKTVEYELFDLPSNVVSFMRFGRPNFSKSKLINGFLCDKWCETFFHKDRPLGMSTRYCSGGYVEMFVLPVISGGSGDLKQPVLLLNVRGDVKTDFTEPVYETVSRISDVTAVIVDSNTFSENNAFLEETVKRFSRVLLIFNGPIGRPNGKTFRMLQKFESNIRDCHTIRLMILSTYSEIDEKNEDVITKETREMISDLLLSDSIDPQSLEDRLDRFENLSIETDESVCCTEAKKSANSIIALMDKISLPDKWVELVTPIQHKNSKKLGMLVKESFRSKDIDSVDDIRTRMSEIRNLEESHISSSIKSLSHCLVKHQNNVSYIHYLLRWVKILLERQKRTCERRAVNSSPLRSDDVSDRTNPVNNTDSSYLEIDHIFREIGHIADSAIISKTNHYAIGFPPISDLAKVVAALVAGGYKLELLDGNNFFLPTEWIKLVLTFVHELTGQRKVLAVSVLGIQSSGKSTLLNTMFGSEFPTGSGRCTKGIQMQMIQVKQKGISDRKHPFEYVLLIDTEGVRAPELLDTHSTGYRRDNEMSTITTGIGDITLLNVMGENSSEMRDILQILVHAFLRLKLANKRSNIHKSCYFLHQNVSDMQASLKMKQGLWQSVKTLDKATEEAASFECISDITKFSEVIEFVPKSHVWYLPNAWQGHPPVARLNQKYCEMGVKLKYHLVNKSTVTHDKSFKTLKDTVLYIEDLWKGVLAENFVFSFRNSIEKKANIVLEKKMKEELWSLECSFDDIMFQKAQNSFNQCESVSSVITKKEEVILEMAHTITNLKSQTLEKMEKFFNEHDYKETMINWKEHTMKHIQTFCKDVVDNRKPEIERLSTNRKIDIVVSTLRIKHEEDLRRKSLELQKELTPSGKNIDLEKANKMFEQIWATFVEKSLSADISRSFESEYSLRKYFLECLRDIYKSHDTELQRSLSDHSFLEKSPGIRMLSESHETTGIDENDISIVSRGGKNEDASLKTIFSRAKEAVQSIYHDVDLNIKHVCQKKQDITYRDIRQFLNKVDSLMKDANTRNSSSFTFTITGILKVVVHVSCYSYFRFKQVNSTYRQSQSLESRLEMYKQIERERFFAYLMERRSEDTAACLMQHAIKDNLRVILYDKISKKVKLALNDKLPSLKHKLLLEIVTELVSEDSFISFMRYILSPRFYAQDWVQKKADHILFSDDSKLYEKLAEAEISAYMHDIEMCLSKCSKSFPGDTVIIKQWFEYFISLLTTLQLPKECFSDAEKELERMEHVNILYFKDKIIENLQSISTALLNEFKATNELTEVTWSGSNPINDLFEKVWGCPEACLFCGEPCILGYTHDGEISHKCAQHRPIGICGVFGDKENTLFLRPCHVNVVGDADAPCYIFDFKCNPQNRSPCKTGRHPFKDYKLFVSDWDIEPKSYSDCSQFWMWFMSRYDKELSSYYKAKLTNVPDWWKSIQVEDALTDLKLSYLVSSRQFS
ncbi:interferon-induced very large GTPase 1-like [Mercenaria mercenaria]|uniref:interferon-induced very large GTPase 1-like n=1 Tax=Mercenaria mercenaria TaxID=6596 RepID=UPI00234FA9DA|nr:interferon-induced very large GTPase 1-like [Mercenaria mercenaria]